MFNAEHCATCGQVLPFAQGIAFDAEQGALTLNGAIVARLTVQEAKFFAVLLDASKRGRLATRIALYDALYWDRGGRDINPKILDVLACKIRKKLPRGVFTLESSWGRGYRLHVNGEAK